MRQLTINVKSRLFNTFCRNIRRKRGSVRLSGHVVCDLAASAGICLCDDLSLGHNLRQGSNAETYLKMHEQAQFIVNGFFKVFYGSSIEIFSGGILTVGDGYINANCVLSCANSITIGNGVAIARGVCIYDSDHHKLLGDKQESLNLSLPIVIGEHVWIGVNAIILKGVTIGNGAVIAAGSVVTHDIPPNCLAAGIPAKVIRSNVNWK